MSMHENSLPLPSLAQHFNSPDEDYIGHFGWLCGYSADASFLTAAADRFTRQTAAQRAHCGRISLAIMLDPGNPQIEPKDSPGVAHLPMITAKNKPFLLLHAKVALLGFRHQNDASLWKMRLIVSTGNWTRQTLEESLDLVWCIDISSEQLLQKDDDVQQCCADIKAAQELLLNWIGKRCDLSLLSARCETDAACKNLSKWLVQCSEKAGNAKPRFFDNREKSMLAQLPNMILIQAKNKVKRNYLAMGSGFYESVSDKKAPKNGVPKVIENLVLALKDAGQLTNSSELDIFVNPISCQAVATSVKNLNDNGFTVRPAAKPSLVFGENSQRTLHAKFLFSANKRDNSNRCNSAWIYLGSGNFTKQGFANRMSAVAGNLEAGVIFTPENLVWESSKEVDPASVVTNMLPMQWDSDISPADKTIQAGGDMPERNKQFVAPPVAWLTWTAHTDGSGGILKPPNNAPFEVLLTNNQACVCNEQHEFIWPGPRPRQVTVRWQTDGGPEQRCVVPVIDEFGRIAATDLPELDIDSAWWQLANFPMTSEEGDPGGSDGPGEGNNHGRKTTSFTSTPSTGTYPIRQMMELIENIAAKQTQVCEEDWPVWCNRLVQTLTQMKDSPVIEYFRSQIKLNPLSPLLAAPFRPCFAETAQTRRGKCYEEALKIVANAWNVNDLDDIGEAQ